MFGRTGNRRGPPEKELAERIAWERSVVDGLVSTIASTSGDPAINLAGFLQAPTTRDALAALERDPELVSERGEAAFDLLVTGAHVSGCEVLLLSLQKRQRWLRQLRETGWGAQRAT